MSLKLPVAPSAYDRGDQSALRGAIERADLQNLKRQEAVDFILLRRTDGTVGKVTADNSNALHFTPL